jgi:hypothetical protein
VGYQRLPLQASYVGEVSIGPADSETPRVFQVANIRGGTWLDFRKLYLDKLKRWMSLVGIGKSSDGLIVVDTTSPMSVAALSALPDLDHRAIIAVAADPESTPIEQNTSYAALSLALRRETPIIAISETFFKEMLYFTEDGGFQTNDDALARLLAPLLSHAGDLMDLLERDLKLGIKMHCMSAIVSGSKSVYGTATNAFMAQSYNVSLGEIPSDYKTVHSLVFSPKSEESEFEKGFGVFRSRKFKGALSAELRFHESTQPLYDLITLYGVGEEAALQNIAGGYEAIVRNVPELGIEEVG